MLKVLLKRLGYTLFGIILLVGSIIVRSNYAILSFAKPYIIESLSDLPAGKLYQTVIVPGAMVYSNGYLSNVTQDRADTAKLVLDGGHALTILVSGDNGTVQYDEVRTIKNYLLKQGVPVESIFQDFAGFDTYDTIYRAQAIFEVKNAIISTQYFHLSRAIYIARKRGIDAIGIVADQREYAGSSQFELRESLARVKAWIEITFGSQPKFLGEKVPINGLSNGKE